MTTTDTVHTDTRVPPRRYGIAIVAALITAAFLAFITPFPRGFQGEVTGDENLMKATAEVLGSRQWNHVAVAMIDGDAVTVAGTGADERTEFEIGSITKTFTAALFAEAIERGEVTESTRLGEVWPGLSGDVAQVTLASIALQRSGLPAQVPAPTMWDGVISVAANYLHLDPYRSSADELVSSLASASVGEAKPEYSNFGFAVLGQALAEVAGTSYSDLVRERITEPLGMNDTYVPDSAAGLSHGSTSSGLPAAPWTLKGSAPAGAIRSTAHDMAIWLRANLSGTAPGAAATEPREDFDDADRIGWAWLTTTQRSPNLTWHNGGTGGYRSYLGFNRESGTGIVVLADTANPVDAAANLISGGR